ncbi:Ima1 N-terminal domain-containing protein [Fennellomyces sp. T-0311]|nr:Ima1 N-terminal domain-containing protein [Fennellomyces sp. T-0311]
MSDHVTNRRPSWRAVVLGFLGLTDLPAKVNCWYCNQDSYLLPGGKQTERYWHCNICENTNVKDERGDIVDNLQGMYDSTLNQPVTPVRDTSQNFQTRRLCESCERNQALIYQIMSDYIRDESDPDYNYYIRTADDYKASLHQKYPLCDNCQAKIDEIVAEQRATLRQRRFNEKLTRSQNTVAPRKPSKLQYRVLSVMWIGLHAMTLLVCLYAYWYPPIRHGHISLSASAKRAWGSFAASVALSTSYLRDERFTLSRFVRDALMLGIQSTWNIAQLLHQATLCFVAPEGADSCQWDYSNHAILFAAVSIFSWLWMDWHPKASKTYFEETRVKRWGIYKVTQRLLFFARLGLLATLDYANDNTIHLVMTLALVIIPLLLVGSVFAVKVSGSEWRLRDTDTMDALQGLKKRYAEIQRFAMDKVAKIGKESVPAAYTQNNESEPQEVDGEMEGIVTGIHKIAFDGTI